MEECPGDQPMEELLPLGRTSTIQHSISGGSSCHAWELIEVRSAKVLGRVNCPYLPLPWGCYMTWTAICIAGEYVKKPDTPHNKYS